MRWLFIRSYKSYNRAFSRAWYFLLPLILACISGAVGIYAMQLYLYSGAAHLEQSYPLLIAMAVIVVLVMVIYGVAVARTANREIGKLNYKPNS